MSPPPEELKLGEKAYRHVRFYENTMKDLRQTHWVWTICGVLATTGLVLWIHHHWPKEHLWYLLAIPYSFGVCLWQQRASKERYADSKVILQLLKDKYGETLPWIVEEKQLARARELEAEIANDRPASHA